MIGRKEVRLNINRKGRTKEFNTKCLLLVHSVPHSAVWPGRQHPPYPWKYPNRVEVWETGREQVRQIWI